jgi:hypothetical protein
MRQIVAAERVQLLRFDRAGLESRQPPLRITAHDIQRTVGRSTPIDLEVGEGFFEGLIQRGEPLHLRQFTEEGVSRKGLAALLRRVSGQPAPYG